MPFFAANFLKPHDIINTEKIFPKKYFVPIQEQNKAH